MHNKIYYSNTTLKELETIIKNSEYTFGEVSSTEELSTITQEYIDKYKDPDMKYLSLYPDNVKDQLDMFGMMVLGTIKPSIAYNSGAINLFIKNNKNKKSPLDKTPGIVIDDKILFLAKKYNKNRGLEDLHQHVQDILLALPDKQAVKFISDIVLNKELDPILKIRTDLIYDVYKTGNFKYLEKEINKLHINQEELEYLKRIIMDRNIIMWNKIQQTLSELDSGKYNVYAIGLMHIIKSYKAFGDSDILTQLINNGYSVEYKPI